MAVNGFRSTYAIPDQPISTQNYAAQNYINQLQNYTQQLQKEIERLRETQPVTSAPSVPDPPADLSLPIRHADIIQVKTKKQVINEKVDNGCSKMFMTETEETIYVKSVDENGNATLYTYLQQDPENITDETDFVTKEDLKTMLADAVDQFSKLVPSEDSFVRKDEIKDIIVETLSSTRSKKKEE